MKLLKTIIALAASAQALQLSDDINFSEEDLFLQLDKETQNLNQEKGKDITFQGTWVPPVPGKAALDYTDPVRESHSATVQDHLTNRVFTNSHNSADELNKDLQMHSTENEKDAEPKE